MDLTPQGHRETMDLVYVLRSGLFFHRPIIVQPNGKQTIVIVSHTLGIQIVGLYPNMPKPFERQFLRVRTDAPLNRSNTDLDVEQRPVHLHLDFPAHNRPIPGGIFLFRTPLRASGRTRDPQVP